MERCDRCGCETNDYYCLSYAHVARDEEGHFFVCPNCKIDFDKYIQNRYKRSFGYRVTLDEYTPGGYKVVKAVDEEL
jgi:hypothetical protein